MLQVHGLREESDPFSLIQQLSRLHLNPDNIGPTSSCNVAMEYETLPPMTFATNDSVSRELAPSVFLTDHKDKVLCCEFYPQQPDFDALSNFVCSFSPSKVTGPDTCNWVAISRGPQPAPPNAFNVEAMKRTFNDLAEVHRRDGNITLTVASLDELGRTFGITKGKWMMFCTTAQVDAVWEKIVRFICLEEAAGGEGGCRYARVSPNKGDDQHVVSVYVDNFENEDEIRRVREALRKMGFDQPIGFKMDAYTMLGIYRKNHWGVSCNRYFE